MNSNFSSSQSAKFFVELKFESFPYIFDWSQKAKRLIFLNLLSILARSEAGRFLIERGAPVGVYDDSGTPCLSLMIEKMPHIAMEAVEQFHNIDRAFRKHYFYLSHLEKDNKYLDDKEPGTNREKREKKERDKEQKRMMKEKGMKKVKKEKTFAKVPIEVTLSFAALILLDIYLFHCL